MRSTVEEIPPTANTVYPAETAVIADTATKLQIRRPRIQKLNVKDMARLRGSLVTRMDLQNKFACSATAPIATDFGRDPVQSRSDYAPHHDWSNVNCLAVELSNRRPGPASKQSN